jgi:E3 ubiquitin-protein ligase CHFR
MVWTLVSILFFRCGARELTAAFISEDLLAVGAPSTTRCDLCHVAFCGISVPERCAALPLGEQRPDPSRFASASDLLLAVDIYDAFDGNAVETEYFIEHLQAKGLSPKHVYRQVRSRN